MQYQLCKLPDLSKAFQKMKAIEGSEKRKELRIQELTREFAGKGFSLGLSESLARERYLLIHKNNFGSKL